MGRTEEELVRMKIKRIEIAICEACLEGDGEMCTTPECALCWHLVDIPISDGLYEVKEEYEATL